MRRIAVLLTTAVLVAGCARPSDPPKPVPKPTLSIEWPALGTGRPVLGVDVYAPSNYPAAVVRRDGRRMLSYIKNVLKADAVGIVWNLFATSDSSDAIEATRSTLSVRNVAVLTRIAEQDHLLVEYRPVILVPGEANSWSGKIFPVDQRQWFDSYYRAQLAYLRLAQSLGVREYVTATEMHDMNGSSLWRSYFARLARVYHGVISYATWDYDYFPPKMELAPLRYLGMDMYWHMPSLPADATTAQVLAAWTLQFNQMPSSALRRTAIDETGIEAKVGAYADPPRLGVAGRLSEQVQVNWFTAACETVHLFHMRGVFFWKVDLADNPARPATSLSTFEGRQGARAISECAHILH